MILFLQIPLSIPSYINYKIDTYMYFIYTLFYIYFTITDYMNSVQVAELRFSSMSPTLMVLELEAAIPANSLTRLE